MAGVPQILMSKPNTPMGWSLGQGFGKWRRSDEVMGAVGVPVRRDSPRAALTQPEAGTDASQEGALGSARAGGGRALRRVLGAGAQPLTRATWGFHSRGNKRC